MTEFGLFDAEPVEIMAGMWLLRRFADGAELAPRLAGVCEAAPLRHMQTRRGFSMSVAMTNCGDLGWVSDRRGYRYSPTDPQTGQRWPAMPAAFHDLATRAAAAAGYPDFAPDVCLVNRYEPGTQMGAHQDRDEQDFSQPIVSVSLGIPARFFVRADDNKGASTSVDLADGDVIIFGGAARRCFHGVRKLKPEEHPVFGAIRWNLTFRCAA